MSQYRMKPNRAKAVRGAAIIALLVGGFSGCQDCILLGCSEGLLVTVVGAPPQGLTVVATDLDGTTIVRRECAIASCFDGKAFFDTFTPENVEISVTFEGVTRVLRFRPEYERTTVPCGDQCDRAEVTFDYANAPAE